VGGYIAPRHLKAIRDTGNTLVAAADTKDSVGLLDQFSFDVRFFTEIERLDRHLEKLRRGPEADRVHWVTVCSPNYLHDAHCRLAMRVGADVICEKPLVINPWNLDSLEELERETGKRVNTVLQLRVHPKLVELREQLLKEKGKTHAVELTYVTSRGPWYDVSWKGSVEKSGGVPTNIGIHFFDLLSWLFGATTRTEVQIAEPRRWSGTLELERANVKWFLSIDSKDLPYAPQPGQKTTYRSITVDGKEIEFSEGFGDLHTRIYEETLAGRGFGLSDARGSIEAVHRIRHAKVTQPDADSHHLAQKLGKGGGAPLPSFCARWCESASGWVTFVHPTAVVDEGAVLGEGTRVWHFCHVSAKAVLGPGCNLGQNVFVAGGVRIGRNVKIQNNVSVYEGVELGDDVFCGPSMVFTNVTNPRSEIVRKGQYLVTKVGRGTSFGANCTIVCGGNIGRYAFVAAGAVVTRSDVPDYALMVGVPARRKGWVSRHGHPLEAVNAQGELVCPESGWRYREVEPGVLRCLDWDEEKPLAPAGKAP
jgi:UDP-N-acetyl-2-amino-2-deoxyglucuronate dehydrogenase